MMKKIIISGKTIITLMVLIGASLITTFGQQITQVGNIQTAYAPSATSITLNTPSGLRAGDIMIVNIVKYTGANSINPSSNGWTLIDGAVLGGANYVRGAVLYRVAGGSEPGNYTFSLGGYTSSAYAEGALVAYTNVNLVNPFDVTPGTITTPAIRPGFTSTTVNPSGITTVSSNALVIMLGMSYITDDAPPSTFDSWSVTSPSITELYDADGTSAVSVGAATGIQNTPGATGTGTITVSDGAYLGGIILALRQQPTEPTLRVDPSSLDFGYVYTGSSVVKTFQLSGELLTGYPGSITVTAPSADFQVSNDNTTWGAATTIAYNSATLSSSNVYVMFAPQSTGVKSGNLTFSGGGVTTPPTVSLTGTATSAATQLAFVNFPAAGTTNNNFAAFTVEARTAENSVDFLFNGDITLTKATGSGTLTGTLTMTAINGVASFSAVQVDQVDSYTLYANSGTLIQTTSGTIVVAAGVLNDYRSAASGNFNSAATWEIYDGSAWIQATSAPTYTTANTITVRNSHVVTVTASVTADQMVVDAGGQVTINSTRIFTIRDGSGTDLTVFGTIDNSGVMIISSGGAAVYYSGGIYRHANSSSTIPTATWNPGSTCEITGWTSAGVLTNSFSQTFYNFTWNCPGQTNEGVSFGGFVNTVNGTFKLVSTGSAGTNRIIHGGNPTYGNYEQTGGIYQLTDGYDASTLTVTGNFSISNGTFLQDLEGPGILAVGGNYSISGGTHTIGNSSTASAMSVAGDFSMTGGSFNISTDIAASTLTVSGNFSITSGTLDMSGGNSSTTLSVAGNFIHSGGTITETSAGNGTIVFNGTYNSSEETGIQTYTSGGTVTNSINFIVNSNAFLQMAAPETVVTGGDIFTLSGGATLGITSPEGITASGATGNIQTGTRTFSAGANYVYNGTAAQSTGDGLPATINNLVLDNSDGDITFNSSKTITNNFSITSGSTANLGSYIHTAGTLTLGEVLQPSGFYGSTVSIATYKIAAYFGTTASGVVNVSSGSLPSSWTGSTSSDWNTLSNWVSGTIPVSTSDVTIASSATNQPVISGSTTAVCNSITIDSGASLTISPTGKATFNSIINNGTLYLGSDATGIASLILGSYTDNGTENIEIYMTGGGNESNFPWHYISIPVTSLSTDVFTTGTEPSYDLAAYYETHASPDHSLRWIAWDGYDYSIEGYPDPLVGAFNTLVPGKGYNIYFYESSVEKTFGGTLNTTDEAESLSYTTGSSNVTQGWNLLGNPFTSGLDWNEITKPAGVDNAIYFTSNNAFASYVGGVGTPAGTTGLIPPMQGFFVKANQSGQSITLTGSAKIHNFHARYKGDEETIPLIRLKFESAKASDETVIRFDEKANSTFDSELDAYKFSKTGTSVGLWTVNGTVSYSINSLPFPETETEVPVGINVSESGSYKLTAIQLQSLDNYTIYLIDKTTGLTTELKNNSTVSFTASAGMVTDRFIIKIVDISTGIENNSVSESVFNIYPSSDFINIQTLSDEWDGKSGSIELLDMTGRTMRNVNNAEFWKSSLIQIPSAGYRGIYFVKLQSGLMRYVGKIIIK